MHPSSFDVAVVGLGAYGSAVLWHLTRRGVRAVGFDRYVPPHHFGSSHGQSRIIRAAYYEHPLYVPLVRRAFSLWKELEEGSGSRLLLPTGGLIVGPEDGTLVPGARTSARLHGLPYESWSADEIRAHVPALRVPDAFTGVWEPGAAMLAPERCIQAMLAEARLRGAETLVDTAVIGWSPDGSGVRIATAASDYHAGSLVLTAGPWLPELLTDLPLPVRIERVVQCWFTPAADPGQFAPGRFPIFLIEDERRRLFYGLPDAGDGVKAAFHHEGESATMADVRRLVAPHESAAVRRALDAWVPDAAGALRDAAVCLYTNTPDGHFVVDRHPRAPNVVLASCCSGHGFKFAVAIGELLADLATLRQPAFDLAPFRLGRFAQPVS